MKRIILAILVLTPLFLLTGCFEKSREENVKIEEREVPQFNKIEWDGVGELKILQSDQQVLKVGAHKNYIEKIKTKIDGTTLKINEESNWFDFTTYGKRKYLVAAPNIKYIELKGVGDVIIEKYKTTGMELILKGKGNYKLDEVDIDNLNIQIKGFGDITASGKAQTQNIEISGSGNHFGYDLKSDNARIDISGIGKGEISVEKQLVVNISGKGNINYIGEPKIDQKISGVGEVNKNNE